MNRKNDMIQDIKHILKTIMLLVVLMTGATVNVCASEKKTENGYTVIVNKEPNDAAGTVTVSSISAEGLVTMTVTPTSDYYTKKSMITVERMVDASLAPRRGSILAGSIAISGTDDEVITGTEYTFNIPSGYKGANVTVHFYTKTMGVSQISTLDELQDISGKSGSYEIVCDIDASGLSSSISGFTGTLDGGLYSITNLSVPLFSTLDGATIKNVILDKVDINVITTSTNAGAIAQQVIGTTEKKASIYNCGILSGSVSGTGYVGGLVGQLGQGKPATSDEDKAKCFARVINCYSYADITGGSVKAGIVGYNSFASTYSDLRTMVMNCMFYGDISIGGTISPIYGGQNISNDYKKSTNNRLNNYNYFLYEAPFSKNNIGNSIFSTYNSALAAEKRFLVRFEFYRHILNSTRELAALYATGNPANGKGIGSANQMAKWVLDKSIAPYPILKAQDNYPSVVNYDPNYTYDADGRKISRNFITERNRGGVITKNNLPQTLTITVSGVGTNAPDNASIKTNISDDILKPNRIDKDTLNFNFNYDKIQLPYYNDVGTGNYTTQTVGTNKISRVVTGWKITSMTNGTGGGYTEDDYDYPNYNYADRDHYGKDIYTTGTGITGNSGRVYAQGAYFNVPKDVTGITIEPYWGRAAYLSDIYYDRYGYNNDDDLDLDNCGPRHTLEEDKYYITIDGSKQQVFTNVSDALGALTGVSTPTVYDYAVVLVGNYHHHATEGRNGPEISNGGKPFTIMSVDLNKDDEPDYCLIYRSGKNQEISPIRFDFITVPGMAMAHKMATNGDLGIPGNCRPKGWFEITTTGLIKYGQFEHSYNSKTLAPLIFMGGVIDQFVANNTGSGESFNNKTKYMLFGDNVWFKMLSNGAHMDKTSPTPHRPISITGGEYESLYLSGYFRPDASACTTSSGDNNAECYIDGGKFGEVAGAGQENISGDVKWMIDHADIKSFYGGGMKVVANGSQITGKIETTIKNSYVDLFCGGPKFGDMAPDKTVKTEAKNCHFGTYFGAGYGGTSIYRECPAEYNKFDFKNYGFNSWVSGSYDNSGGKSYRGKYLKENVNNVLTEKGIACGYEYELFAGAQNNVGRLHLKYASFSLAQTNNVSSELSGCTVDGNFYGGGSLGKVAGTATSTLYNCTVNGSVFGAGYSASTPTASIMALGGFKVNGVATNPNYNETTAVYEKADYPSSTEYKWVHETTTITSGTQTLSDNPDGTHTIKTNGNVDGLGRVTGKVTLNITGNTIVKGNEVSMDKDGYVVKDVNGEPIVTAFNVGGVFGGGDASDAEGDTEVNINTPSQKDDGYNVSRVFGGGNKAKVYGNTVVNLVDGVINADVFGGGNNGEVGGSTTVNIQKE